MATETIREGLHAYVLQPNEGQLIDDLHLRIMATEAMTGGTLMAGECVNPGPGGPALHTHHAHDELYLVLQGRYRFKIGEDVHEGGPGMFVYAPRGTTHTFASVGSEEGRIFFLSLPGLEAFLERMSRLPVRGNTREGLGELFHDFNSEINGPPLV
ncbi:MAG TPA: cupin domain-containing protein [Chloroflexota bacterium]|nr:cupin domain-containing protein [Chloroflexota bacterium]